MSPMVTYPMLFKVVHTVNNVHFAMNRHKVDAIKIAASAKVCLALLRIKNTPKEVEALREVTTSYVYGVR